MQVNQTVLQTKEFTSSCLSLFSVYFEQRSSETYFWKYPTEINFNLFLFVLFLLFICESSNQGKRDPESTVLVRGVRKYRYSDISRYFFSQYCIDIQKHCIDFFKLTINMQIFLAWFIFVLQLNLRLLVGSS